MKQLFTTLAFCCLVFGAFAQPDFNKITDALRRADVATLASTFDDNVEMTILSQDDLYDRSGATKAVQEFLNAHRPSACTLVHKGTSNNNGSYYGIASLSSGGKNYRVYIYMKLVAGTWRTQELRFENE